ncbi:MAG: Trm112 family protein [Propionibacteriaceae bacterium]|nr:Trm112 family protein [Propionibacteriaceae bacterium]
MSHLDAMPQGLLDILVCPACHGTLAIDYDAGQLVCTTGSCGLAYTVTGGVPVMLVDEARKPERP